MNENAELRETVTRQVPVEMTLNHLAELAKKLSSDHVFEDAKNLAERIAEGRFYVACIGQFKRGKSTLLGALLGDRVLPAGVLPVTAVATVIRYGSSRAARVRFRGGEWADIAPEDVTDYVSEEHNSENVKGVAGIEVFVPSPLLADGMCLCGYTRPGFELRGEHDSSQAFIPHIDAAIVVVGVDPPITAEELTVLEQVGKQVQDLVVVLNKADRDSDKEREVVKSFTSAAIEKRLGRPIRRIFEVSAEERLQNRGPERDWEKLIVALETLVRQSGRSLVRAAGGEGFSDSVRNCWWSPWKSEKPWCVRLRNPSAASRACGRRYRRQSNHCGTWVIYSWLNNNICRMCFSTRGKNSFKERLPMLRRSSQKHSKNSPDASALDSEGAQ